MSKSASDFIRPCPLPHPYPSCLPSLNCLGSILTFLVPAAAIPKLLMSIPPIAVQKLSAREIEPFEKMIFLSAGDNGTRSEQLFNLPSIRSQCWAFDALFSPRLLFGLRNNVSEVKSNLTYERLELVAGYAAGCRRYMNGSLPVY